VRCNLDATETRWRRPVAYDNGELGMKRLLVDHMDAKADIAVLCAEVRALREVERERDEAREALDRVTSISRSAGNAVANAAVAEVRALRKVAEAAHARSAVNDRKRRAANKKRRKARKP